MKDHEVPEPLRTAARKILSGQTEIVKTISWFGRKAEPMTADERGVKVASMVGERNPGIGNNVYEDIIKAATHAIREAEAAMQERCAQVAHERAIICEDAADKTSDSHEAQKEMCAAIEASYIADKIRALGKDNSNTSE